MRRWASLWLLIAACALICPQLARKAVAQADPDQVAAIEAISRVFRDVAKKAQPAVVHIIVRTAPKAEDEETEGVDLDDLPEALREFFKQHPQFRERGLPGRSPRRRVPRMGMGSGVIVDAKNGYIITNNHVVEAAADTNSRIDVILSNSETTSAKIMGRDPRTDLAMLKISTKGQNLHELPVGDSADMEVGDWVLAIGAPFGLAQTVTQGIISAKGRDPGIVLGYEDFIQTDAAINPGNSGGPLINLKGQIVGINTAIATGGMVARNAGIGFAVPSETIKELLPAFKEGREIVRGYLGVSIKGLADAFEPGIGKTYGLPDDVGILVEEAFPGTPAAKAGLKPDDVILAYGDRTVTNVHELQRWVASTKVDSTVNLKVWRDEKEITIPVKIEKQPEDFFDSRRWQQGGDDDSIYPDQEPAEEEIETLGMTVGKLTPELAKKFGWDTRDEDAEGLVVLEVEPLGEAGAVLGINPGDLIVHVGGKEIKSPQQLRKTLNEKDLAKGVRMRIRDVRTGRSRTLFVHVTP